MAIASADLIGLPGRALTLASIAHEGQKRRDKKTPYITHPIRVASQFSDPVLQAIGYLHDTIEDTPANKEIFNFFGIPDRVYDAVIALSMTKYETYTTYLIRVRLDDLARQVKVADIYDNLNDSPTAKQRAKYDVALRFLQVPRCRDGASIEQLEVELAGIKP